MPEDEIVGAGVLAAPDGDGQFDLGVAAARGIPRHGHDRAQKGGDIDRACVASRQLRIEAGSVGDIADQPIKPPNVMLHDGDKSSPRVTGVHPRQRFERAAQRGQRILSSCATSAAKLSIASRRL